MKLKLPKGKYFSTLFIMTIITACQNGKPHTEQTTRLVTTKSSKKESAAKTISDSNCDATIVNNEFSYDVLAFEVFKADTNKIKSLFLDPVVLKMEKQKNAEGVPYYQYEFTDGINKITLFQNAGFYIEDSEIRNNKVRLNKKISIGMKEDVFLRLLKVANFKCDTISVVNDESSFESVYIFKNAKLSLLKMGQTVE